MREPEGLQVSCFWLRPFAKAMCCLQKDEDEILNSHIVCFPPPVTGASFL